jgi:hypothetical protein
LPEPLSRLPASIIAGYSLSWLVPQGEFSPDDGWDIRYVILSESAQLFINPPSGTNSGSRVDNGDGTWTVSMSPAQTTTLADGKRHRFIGYVFDGTDEHVVDESIVLVKADPKTASAGLDPRSNDEVMLEAVRAVMAGKATDDQAAKSIGGRSLSRYSWGELLEVEKELIARVDRQKQKERIRKGLPSGRKVLARMVAPS